MTSEKLSSSDDGFAQEYEREIELYPAIRQAHLKLQKAQKRDRMLALGDADGNRRFAFFVDAETTPLTITHARYTLIPDMRVSAVADIQRLVVRVPMAENVIASNHERPAQGTKALMPTNDFVAEAFNSKDESIIVLVNQEGMKAVSDMRDISKTSESDFVFSGQALTVLPSSSQHPTQVELESQWFDILELQTMLTTYDPDLQNNAGSSSVANVA